MKKLLYFLILSFFLNFIGLGQSILVNPDGTHSSVFHNGNISTIVNPDSTHSTVKNNRSKSTLLIPKSKHLIKDSTANSFGLRDSLKINIGDTISNSIPAKNQN